MGMLETPCWIHSDSNSGLHCDGTGWPLPPLDSALATSDLVAKSEVLATHFGWWMGPQKNYPSLEFGVGHVEWQARLAVVLKR